MVSKYLFLIVFFTLNIKNALFSGFFELKIKSFSQKSFQMSFCLKEFLQNSQNSFNFSQNSCTFGKQDFILKQNQQIIKIPFEFRWTGSFSLLILSQSLSTNEKPSNHAFSSPLATPTLNWTLVTLSHAPFELHYRVTCAQHYFGADCASFCRPRDDSFGHFECIKGKKTCLKGWIGSTCDTPKCRLNCNEVHGFCAQPDECTCRTGWKGVNCDECVEYPGCLHGYCLRPFECNCHNKWGGVLCDQDLDFCHTHRPCANQGTCLNLRPPNLYQCLCKPGFEGSNCQTLRDACATLPCLNQGTCHALDNGTRFQCACAKGFKGMRCEVDEDDCASAPCKNGGKCVDLTSGHFRCVCPKGLTGSLCEEDVNECESTSGHSICVSEHSIQCLNLFNGFKCLCKQGFEGIYCETEENNCLNKEILCKNGGKCLDLLNDFRCACLQPFSGQFCEHVDTNTCENEENALSWSFNQTLCLCQQKTLKCIQINETSGSQHFRCAPNGHVVFSSHVQNACSTLHAFHSIISGNSNEFCCFEEKNSISVSFYSPEVKLIGIYLTSGYFLSEFKEFFDKSFENNSKNVFKIIFFTIFSIFCLFFVIFLYKKRLFLKTRDSEPEITINCIQNNLREENCK